MNDIRLHSVLLGPHTTEKSVMAAEKNRQIYFKVLLNARKDEVKEAVEKLFKVAVDSVNIMKVRGKTKRFRQRTGKRSDWKKAVVSLAPGHDINLAEFQVEG